MAEMDWRKHAAAVHRTIAHLLDKGYTPLGVLVGHVNVDVATLEGARLKVVRAYVHGDTGNLVVPKVRNTEGLTGIAAVHPDGTVVIKKL